MEKLIKEIEKIRNGCKHCNLEEEKYCKVCKNKLVKLHLNFIKENQKTKPKLQYYKNDLEVVEPDMNADEGNLLIDLDISAWDRFIRAKSFIAGYKNAKEELHTKTA